ncbi:hypothetical protein F4782DRAFT_534758 [Xylaria castorea]|nr:hypothetical protein F4782DRAFT_534758 [Xylaria castorea]
MVLVDTSGDLAPIVSRPFQLLYQTKLGTAVQRYAFLLAHFCKTAITDVDKSQVKRFYEFIVSQQHGKLILDSVFNPQGIFAHEVALKANANDDFRSSTSAEAGLLNLWIYTQLNLKAKNINLPGG